jgi:hypothetical protein
MFSDQFKHKMQSFEAAPPPAAWQAIADRLSDDQQFGILSTKMLAYEDLPPPAVWENIEAILEVSGTGSIKKKVFTISTKWYSVAAAAVFAGLLLGSYFYATQQRANNDVVLRQNNNFNANRPLALRRRPTVEPIAKHKNNEVLARVDEGNGNDVPISAIQKEIIEAGNDKLNSAEEMAINPTAVAPLNYPSLDKPAPIHADLLKDEMGVAYQDISTVAASGNYMMVAGPNGQMTRISSKFANGIRYLNRTDNGEVEEYLDKVLKDGAIWRERFKAWRLKINQSGYVPSPDNFLDIIQLKNLIEEK